MGTLHVVVGGQLGSEAKGHVAGYLARRHEMDAVVRVAGPNAGHTAYDDQGRRWALRQIPVAAVTNLDCELLIAAGSEIDPDVLNREVEDLEAAGIPVMDRLVIDPQATIISPEHKDQERNIGLTAKVGSTAKGIGAARSSRIMRSADIVGSFTDFPYRAGPVAGRVADWMSRQGEVLIEGTQGYGLGLHAGYYPHCTSSDCTAIDFLSMVGVSPWLEYRSIGPAHDFRSPIGTVVWPVFRTFPIRVAGNSGPLRNELTWDQMAERTGGHVQPERTTVTQLVRRIGEWDADLARAAMRANGAPSHSIRPALTFLDYLHPDLANKREIPADHPARSSIRSLEADIESAFHLVATGPNTIIEF